MTKVSKGTLKAKMLAFFREVERTGEPLVVTDRGRPVLKVVPYSEPRSARDVFADVLGAVVYHGDVLEPTEAEWGCDNDDDELPASAEGQSARKQGTGKQDSGKQDSRKQGAENKAPCRKMIATRRDPSRHPRASLVVARSRQTLT